LFSGWLGAAGKEKAGGEKTANKADHKSKEQMSFGEKFFTHINFSLDGKPQRPEQAGRRAPDPARESVF
jgi:hypothetical protein